MLWRPGRGIYFERVAAVWAPPGSVSERLLVSNAYDSATRWSPLRVDYRRSRARNASAASWLAFREGRRLREVPWVSFSDSSAILDGSLALGAGIQQEWRVGLVMPRCRSPVDLYTVAGEVSEGNSRGAADAKEGLDGTVANSSEVGVNSGQQKYIVGSPG